MLLACRVEDVTLVPVSPAKRSALMVSRLRSTLVPVCALAVVAVVVWAGLAQADRDGAPIGDVVQSFNLRDMQWPSVGSDVIGYEFDPEALAALSGTSVKSTSTTWELLPSRTTFSGEYCWSSGYAVAVTRSVTLETRDNRECSISVSVFPSAEAAREQFIARFERMSLGNEFLNVAATQEGTGHVCLIADAVIEAGPNGERIVHRRWGPSRSRELHAFYYNTYVHVSIERRSSLRALDVVKDVVAAMEAQREADPKLPDASLELGAATVKAERLPGATVSLTFRAEWNEEPCSRHFFVTARGMNLRFNEAEETLEPDPDQPYQYTREFVAPFDDAENPTKTESWTQGTEGHYHVVMVAWGDNLLPKVVYQPLEVTD
jgi:hypothetical protein